MPWATGCRYAGCCGTYCMPGCSGSCGTDGITYCCCGTGLPAKHRVTSSTNHAKREDCPNNKPPNSYCCQPHTARAVHRLLHAAVEMRAMPGSTTDLAAPGHQSPPPAASQAPLHTASPPPLPNALEPRSLAAGRCRQGSLASRRALVSPQRTAAEAAAQGQNHTVAAGAASGTAAAPAAACPGTAPAAAVRRTAAAEVRTAAAAGSVGAAGAGVRVVEV